MKVFALLVIAVAVGYGASAPLLDCKFCINFAEQFIDQLVNIVANVGVIGGCADLCQMLANTVTHNEAAGVVCNILCDIVGIREFVAILNKADIDPIYYCELLNTCPIKDDGDATINSFIVSPNIVPYGSKFSIILNYTTVNGTGTGENSIFIQTVDGMPVFGSFLMEPQPPNTYSLKWDSEARPDPDCDPTQGFCEMWLPGNYTVRVEICNGQCGSQHPHSKIYDRATAFFNVTRQ